MKRLLLLLMISTSLWAQDTTCNSGDIMWVSSAVNADVGLGAGAGRCLANTVAGANFNDSAVPFGVQGAMDCLCAGVEIRILGDTGDYGSGTSSWNNRFAASKVITHTINSGTPYPVLRGFPTTATNCDDITNAGCPVDMNFTGGSGDGWDLQQRIDFTGIRVFDASNDCFVVTGTEVTIAQSEADSCGNIGINGNGGLGDVSFIRNYVHDTVDQGIRANAADTVIQWNEIVDTGQEGIEVANSNYHVNHNIVNGTTVGDCITIRARGAIITWNTLRNCAGDGIGIGLGGNRDYTSVAFNVIADNGGWGVDAINQAGRMSNVFLNNLFDGNTSGTFNTANITSASTNLLHGNAASTITFASATDSSITAGGTMTFTWPRGLTTVTLKLGAVP